MEPGVTVGLGGSQPRQIWLPGRNSAMSRDISNCYHSKMLLLAFSSRGHDAPNYSTVHGTALQSKGLSSPKCPQL